MKQKDVNKSLIIGYRDYNEELHQLKRSCKSLTELRGNFEALGLKWETSTLRDILAGGDEAKQKINESIEIEVNRSSVPAIRQKTERGLGSVRKDLIKLINDVKAVNIGQALPEHIEIKDEAVCHVEGYEEIIKDRHAIVLESDLQKQAWVLANEIASKIAELQTLIAPYRCLVLEDEYSNRYSLLDSKGRPYISAFPELKRFGRITYSTLQYVAVSEIMEDRKNESEISEVSASPEDKITSQKPGVKYKMKDLN